MYAFSSTSSKEGYVYTEITWDYNLTTGDNEGDWEWEERNDVASNYIGY